MALKTITLSLPEWRPDAADLNTNFLTIAKNVLATPSGYGRFGGVSSISGAPALASRCYGAAFADQGTDTLVTFAGSATLLNRRTSGAFADVSRLAGGSYAAAMSNRWVFAQAGTALIAVNPNDDPQVYSDVSTSTNFAALGGSPPRATGVSQVGDFTFLWGLASNKRKLQWSAINSITGWTVGTNLSDEQTFPDLGNITGVYGGQNGFVLQQWGVRSFQFLPGDTATIFQFAKVPGALGCISPYGWAAATDGNIYYLSFRGIHVIGPGGYRDITQNRLSDWLRTNADRSAIFNAECVAHATKPLVLWGFRDNNSDDYTRILVYDYSLDKFVYGDSGIGTGAQCEAFVKHSYGSAAPSTSAIDHVNVFSVSAHVQSVLSSLTALTATITFPEIELFPGRMALVSAIRPLCNVAELDNMDVSTSYRNTLEASPTTSTTTTADTTGKFNIGSGGITARFHKFSLDIAGTAAVGTDRFLGIQVIASDQGEA